MSDELEDSDIDDDSDEIDVDVLTAKAVALFEKYQAEADYARWQARREELAYQQESLEHAWQLNGNYSFSNEVTQKSADRLLHAMSLWHQHDPAAPWTIYLNSTGGSVFAGNSIIDELIAHSRRGGGTHDVTIKVRGVALSMGSLILQAGDHRVIGRNSMLMIHKGSDVMAGTADDIADMAEWFKRDTDWMINYFLDRTDRITRAQFHAKIRRKDWWLNSTEALDLGFVDTVG